ncbi:MAG: hypothetical protein OEY49_09910, partial [Candidatus Heimdallarchaeota archaeon]|nr:hypothetical protein [Candidatus Heimdallarchaeota archaeon]
MSNLDILLKIGGSVLTAKNTTDIINQEIIRELSNEIKSIYNAGYSICIVTGVGNLGHQTVAKYGIQKGDNKSIERRLGLVDAQLQVNIIRNVLLQSLYLAEIPCVQLYASSIIISNNMMITQTFFDSIQG